MIGIVSASLAIPPAAMAETKMGMSSAAPAERGVRVVTCAVDPIANVINAADGVGPTSPETASNINVVFLNLGRSAADSVAFLVTYHGERRRIVDRGHFSPGIAIDHRFLEFAGVPYLGEAPDSCTVADAHFEDGTVLP